MAPEQIAHVQDTFKLVLPIKETAAKLFYDRLFALDPDLRTMFKGDMAEQGRKLMTVLATAVGNLDRLDEILPTVRALGERHAGFGVTPAHYETVGEALIWTLEQGLTDTFTSEVRAAWVEVYGALSSVMQAAAAKQAAA